MNDASKKHREPEIFVVLASFAILLAALLPNAFAQYAGECWNLTVDPPEEIEFQELQDQNCTPAPCIGKDICYSHQLGFVLYTKVVNTGSCKDDKGKKCTYCPQTLYCADGDIYLDNKCKNMTLVPDYLKQNEKCK